jgi:subtilisin family serine protease/streptogramin lyase
MKRIGDHNAAKLAACFIGLVASMCFASSATAAPQAESIVPNHYIVLFKDSVEHPGELARAQTQSRGGSVGLVYHDLNGYSAELPAAAVEALRKNPRVASVEPDVRGGVASQTTPTGIKRVFATANEALDIDEKDDFRVNVNVAVIDTGIDYTHPDLNVVGRTDCTAEAKKATECVNESGTDGYGHGTHVAGTIGAIDNGEGVVGVAPGARLWGVKVLDNYGDGSLDEFIAGIEWITATRKDANPENDIAVANASLRYFTETSEATSKALKESVEAGVVWVVAAGNEREPVKYLPGIDPSVITVSAITDHDGIPGGKGSPAPTCTNWGEDDKLASFSNYGKDVEIAAPGVCIYSTVPGGGYGYKSGTSMASPHVAGAAAILAAKSIPKSMKDVEAIRSTLIKDGKTVEAEGVSNWTDTSGDGIQEPLLYVGGFPPPLATTEAATSVSTNEATLNGSVNPGGFKTTYQFEYGTSTSYNKVIPIPAKEVGLGTKAVKVSETIGLGTQKVSLEPNTTYHYRITATNIGGTTKGEDKTFTTPRLVGTPTYVSSFGTKGSEDGQFQSPKGVAVDSKGNVWVVDKNGKRIEKFNSKGEFLLKAGSKGKEDGQFEAPWDIAVDAADNVWVTDMTNIRVQKFNSEGKYLSKFGSKGTEDGQLFLPQGIDVDSAGNVWVADANGRVQKFSPEGKYLLKAGSKGAGDGQHTEPCGIAVDSEGNIWVVDRARSRIQKFNSKGEYLAKFGEFGAEGGKFEHPVDIAIDSKGNLWVTDAGHYRVQEIYPEGEYVTQFGKQGSGEGEFLQMVGIAADPEGNLWVADSELANRIQRWKQPAAPAVATEAAKPLERTRATLNGSINPEGKATSYQFEWGATTSYGKVAPASPKSIGSGSSPVKVSEVISGLKANTTYYYHVAAITEKGTVYGETRHFTTLPGPGAEPKWRIGGKTLAEAGIKEATFVTGGPFTIEIPVFKTVINCKEFSTGKISGTNSLEEKITLTECKYTALESCEIKPMTLPNYIGTPASLTSESPFMLETTGSCSPFGAQNKLTVSPFVDEIGTEAASLPVNTTATSKFGANPMYFSGVSTWALTGAQLGKTIGYW